ncbi:MAG: hypothetical protein DRQ88_08200 [Epsilonproteobacteria bacterium]|nr:MAG: hypothetical protein DRQ89_09220 [Campylobacterota bacterium]RLA66030.1 MAG: hypothetical protein DRQ88_08200 [Campylobacterota bacterium]
MIKKMLLDKWSKNQMGHFFILRGPKDPLSKWAHDLLEEIVALDFDIEKAKAKDSLEHGLPDILEIKKEKEFYSWSKVQNDFTEFFKFLQYNPIKLKRKIVILHDAHGLTRDICNKILTTLEEAKGTTIFFLNPTEIPMLATIESRAISLRPIAKTETREVLLRENINFSSWLKRYLEEKEEDYLPPLISKQLISFMEQKEGVSGVIEALKNDKVSQNNLFTVLLDWEGDHNSSFGHKKRFLEETLRFKESKTYNNPYRERFFGLLTLCAKKAP